LAHYCASAGLYQFIFDVLVGEYDFDINFYEGQCKRTLVQIMLKDRQEVLNGENKVFLTKVFEKSDNLLLRNNTGDTLLETIEKYQP
jgi:hypothetical protein